MSGLAAPLLKIYNAFGVKTGLEKGELDRMQLDRENRARGEQPVPEAGSSSTPVRASLAMAAMELVLAFNMSRINIRMVKDHSMRPGTAYYTKWSRGAPSLSFPLKTCWANTNAFPQRSSTITSIHPHLYA